MEIERLKRYQKDPLYRVGWVYYQDDCRFYPLDFEVRDQCMSLAEGYLQQTEMKYMDDDQMLGIFIKAGLVLTKKIKEPDNLQKKQNEGRLSDWIAKKLLLMWKRKAREDVNKKPFQQERIREGQDHKSQQSEVGI